MGTLAWLAKETRCDIAGRTALLQQAFPRPMIKDLLAANALAEDTIANKDIGIRVMPIPLSRLQAGTVADASWGNAKEFGRFLESEASQDYWEQQQGFWVRHHITPRTIAFHPAASPGGPDLHSLTGERHTVMVSAGSHTETTLHDQWHKSDGIRELASDEWTGSTWFEVAETEEQQLKHTDIHSGFEQLEKLYSQGGEVIMLYDRELPQSQSLQDVTIASWKSYRLKRRTVNTLSSETQAMVRGLGSVHWYRVLILETLGFRLSARDWQREVCRIPFICVTDSKSFFDTVQKCMNPSSQCDDKRTSIDIALIKQELADLNGRIRWIDGRVMPADGLTKNCKVDYLRRILRTGQWCILEEGAALQKKLSERHPGETLFLFSPF